MIKFLYVKKQKKFILLYNKKQRGLSLIELTVVVVILGIVVLGLVTFFMGGTKSWVTGQYQLKAQREARQAIDRMVREIREGKNVISDSDYDTIKVSIPDLGSKPAYDVTYNLSGTTIQRDTNLLIDNVQSLVFTYFDNTGEQICDVNGDPINPLDSDAASKVSKVHINLQVDVDDDGNPDITLNTDVNLRNFSL